MKTFFIAILSIALSVAAQFSLKAGMSSGTVKALLDQPHSAGTLFRIVLDKYILGGFFLYALGALVWLGVLSRWEVSKAYPLVGLGFIFTLVVGYFVGEQVTAARVMGVLLVCAGVYLIGGS
jgi:drug/metabolite transporter (DMT)-like permease